MADTAGRRGLGRGLSALLGEDLPVYETEIAASAGTSVQRRDVPIELLRRNPDQPRRRFDTAELEELASSIQEHGVIQPILVRPALGAPGEYQIVAGERRWRAAQQARLHEVPVVVRDLDDAAVAEISIIENVQRTDLDPLEEATGYKALIDRFGRTQDAVAKTVGKSRSHVANTLRLLSLPDAIREHLASRRLSAGHARAVATAPNPVQLAQTIVDQDLSVRQAEALARKAQDRPARKPKSDRLSVPPVKDADTHVLEQDLSDILGLKVEILDRAGQGEVRISYASLEQLDDICRRLSGAEG